MKTITKYELDEKDIELLKKVHARPDDPCKYCYTAKSSCTGCKNNTEYCEKWVKPYKEAGLLMIANQISKVNTDYREIYQRQLEIKSLRAEIKNLKESVTEILGKEVADELYLWPLEETKIEETNIPF